MARRIPKPFAVEIRSSRTRSKLSHEVAPLNAPSVEQPRVSSWPGLDQEPAGSLQGAELALAVAEVPVRRVLPVLNEPDALAERLASEPPPRRRGRPKKIAALEPERPIDVLAETVHDPEAAEGAPPEPADHPVQADVEGMAAILLLRRGRKRLPRTEFQPGHRWRSRLAAGVHLGRKKPGRI